VAFAAADQHREWADRAERLAIESRARVARAHAAAEHHDRMARESSDARHVRLHRSSAAIHRDAVALHERAAALHTEHADHELRAADRTDVTWLLPGSPSREDADALADRYAVLIRQQTMADHRDVVARERDRLADERDRIADDRDRKASARDAASTAREHRLGERERRAHDPSAPPGHRNRPAAARPGPRDPGAR
jgi:hypothetical protein